MKTSPGNSAHPSGTARRGLPRSGTVPGVSPLHRRPPSAARIAPQLSATGQTRQLSSPGGRCCARVAVGHPREMTAQGAAGGAGSPGVGVHRQGIPQGLLLQVQPLPRAASRGCPGTTDPCSATESSPVPLAPGQGSRENPQPVITLRFLYKPSLFHFVFFF